VRTSVQLQLAVGPRRRAPADEKPEESAAEPKKTENVRKWLTFLGAEFGSVVRRPTSSNLSG
jgi:hypothetical protein